MKIGRTHLLITSKKVQWKVQFAELIPANVGNIGSELPINMGNISYEEVVIALKCLSGGKAAGGDEVPPELWKLLVASEEGVHQYLFLYWQRSVITGRLGYNITK